MSVHVDQLGSPRTPDDDLRIGTVRRPTREVPNSDFSRQTWYDFWFPNLASSEHTMKIERAATTPKQWTVFTRKYKAEMKNPGAQHDLELLARLSHTADFSDGCYCEDEAHCHRSILKQLLLEKGARVA